MGKRQAKIVATLGPSSSSEVMIERLIETGVNVFRLNFSHGDHKSHEELFYRVREIAKRLGRHIAILQDISGPKVRIGEVEGAIELSLEDRLIFTKEQTVGSNENKTVSLSYPEILDVLKEGDRIYLADGTMKVEVELKQQDRVVCKILIGGKLTSKKGVNFPGVKLPVKTITDKDRRDLEFGAKLGVDLVALSFVRTAENIMEAKEILKTEGKETPVFAKIEMIEAMENLDAILDVADGIMVARGDLGVEFGLAKIPVAQKQIIKKANFKGLPVITATQLLSSMVNSPYPTRAEVSDIANALIDGTDAVMLSDESAAGKFSVESVQTLVETIEETEKAYGYYQHKNEEHPIKEAIAVSAATLCETIRADGIIVFTTTGTSAYTLAKYRPNARIIATSSSEETLRKLAVVWGVEPTLCMERVENSDKLVYNFLKSALENDIIDKEKHYILTVGSPKSKMGSTNMIRVMNNEVIEQIIEMFERE